MQYITEYLILKKFPLDIPKPANNTHHQKVELNGIGEGRGGKSLHLKLYHGLNILMKNKCDLIGSQDEDIDNYQ